MHDNVIEIQNILQHTFAICLQRSKGKSSTCTFNKIQQNVDDDEMTDCN